MESNKMKYNHSDSFKRIDQILDGKDYSYEESDLIPSRDKLTYTNGFYVNCSAMFVDLKGSSQLPDVHLRPTLAKIYRTFISEVAAVMNDHPNCAEINIVGDCVSGIFNCTDQADIDLVFTTARKVSSLLDVMNHKFGQKDIKQIEAGIGISYGRALMIKAGYYGSGVNDVVWMGDVVNEASNLTQFGGNGRVICSETFYNKLCNGFKSFLKHDPNHGFYYGHVSCWIMNDWLLHDTQG